MNYLIAVVMLYAFTSPEFCHTMNMTTERIRIFLDSEQRPNAKPITRSSAHVISDLRSDLLQQIDIQFNGVLGAIVSERNQGQYVGFTGVEFDSNKISHPTSPSFAGLVLRFTKIEPGDLVLTAQLVIAQSMDDALTFECDFKVPALSAEYGQTVEIPFDDFYESFRGRLTSKRYKQQGLIHIIRIFAKRSLNDPTSSEPLKIFFGLKDLLLSEP